MKLQPRSLAALLCIATIPLMGCARESAPPAEKNPDPEVSTFEDPLPRWATFFKNNFGAAPGPALVGDFNGDGQTDVATRVGSQFVVFHDTQAAEPREWELVTVDDGVKVEIKPAAFAIEQIPLLKDQISEKQNVLVTGEKSPILIFWYPKESAYAWLQAVPNDLEASRADAQKRLNVSFGITKNNLFGLGSGFYGELHLVEQFVGDFDGDGVEEFLAVQSGNTGKSQFYLYKPGSLSPVIQEIPYSGTKASLHQNPNRETIGLPDFDGNQKLGHVKTKGAYVEIWNPEKSGVVVLLDKDWKMYWVSD